MATPEVNDIDEITTGEDLFHAAVKQEDDVTESRSPTFTSARIKQEPEDYDETSTVVGTQAVEADILLPPVEMVNVDSLAVKTEREEELSRWHASNPEVDPLQLPDLKQDVKEEPDSGHQEDSKAMLWPLFTKTEETIDQPGPSSAHPVSAAEKVNVAQVSDNVALRFTCDICSKQFKRKHHLIAHMLVHSSDKPFTCSLCDARFKRKLSLQTHIRCHSNDKPFSCSQCNATFKIKYNLQAHMKCHSNDKPFPCNQCKMSFKSKQYLQRHMRSHSDVCTFSCDICKCTFKRKWSLPSHMAIHFGPSSFTCKFEKNAVQCLKTFTSKRDLKRHMVMHSNLRAFACHLCPKTFKTKPCLYRHIETHSTELQYTCGQCEWKFRSKGCLNRHVKTFHSLIMPRYDNGECWSLFFQ